MAKNRNDGAIEKLCALFHDKKNYGISYRLSKLFIQLGLEIKVNSHNKPGAV